MATLCTQSDCWLDVDSLEALANYKDNLSSRDESVMGWGRGERAQAHLWLRRKGCGSMRPRNDQVDMQRQLIGVASRGFAGSRLLSSCGIRTGGRGIRSGMARQYMYKFQQHNSYQASSGDNGAAVTGGGAESVIWAPRKPDRYSREGAGSSPGRSSGKRCP